MTDEDLILFYYGERVRRASVQTHLDSCEDCAARYGALAATLRLVTTPEAPDRGDQYGLEVWQRIRHQLPAQDVPWWAAWFRADRLAMAGVVSVLLLAAFVAGRFWSGGGAPAPSVAVAPPRPAAPTPASPVTDDVQQRILLTSVADYLDRSERVLTDIMNTPAGDISSERRWAEDLVATSRLYRQDAADAGEHSVAAVLDDLERNLLEIVHTPSRATAANLDEIRRRIDAAALVFKVRVLSNELRERETPDRAHTRTLTSQSS